MKEESEKRVRKHEEDNERNAQDDDERYENAPAELTRLLYRRLPVLSG
jgi:hypothetical protein